jgi:hypothetical protein
MPVSYLVQLDINGPDAKRPVFEFKRKKDRTAFIEGMKEVYENLQYITIEDRD